jgi:tRNA modification GTPase
MPAEQKETIVAVATPSGRGALALLRISGPEAFEIAAKCIREKALFGKAPARYIGLYTAEFPTKNKIIDQVTIIKYCNPGSYTGENMVEIICHGGELIVRELINAFKSAGARGAQRGEFTRRALENGKIDILKAEAIQALIESESEAELEGSRKLYFRESLPDFDKWREEIIGLLEDVEARIEFEDEGNLVEGKGSTLERIIETLNRDLEKRRRIKGRDGVMRVVIGGPANAGKSTLFNRLLGYNRAIVHSSPGTTRDLVGESVTIGEHEVQLIDCAGIRETVDEIEKDGIERSKKAILGASILVWVTAADEKITDEECTILARGLKPILCIINKIDIAEGYEKRKFLDKAGIQNISISLRNDPVEKIEIVLKNMVEGVYGQIEVPDYLFNSRHEEIAMRLVEELEGAKDTWNRPEIGALHLRGAVACFEEFFGRSDTDAIMNGIFEKFCIGK